MTRIFENAGTFYNAKDDPFPENAVIVFSAREDAENFLLKNGMEKSSSGKLFFTTGTYYLNHGEYERPDYKIKKIRSKNLYAIWASYYYYPNTFYARQDHFMTAKEFYI